MAMVPPDSPEHAEIRASDADRENAVAILRHHCTEGRLTLDEFSDRLPEVYAARTWADLDHALRELPMPAPPAAAPVRVPGRRRARRWVVGVMSGAITKGRWRTSERTTAIAFMGASLIDLRQAEFEGPELHITAIAFMGAVEIIVPEGIEVVVSGFPFMGGIDSSKANTTPRVPGTPLVRVRAFAMMGGIDVRTRKTEEEEKAERLAKRRHRELKRMGRRGGALPTTPVPPPLPGIRRSDDGALLELASVIQAEHPDLAGHAAPNGTVTVLFSDIEGSSELNERLGDLRWVDVLRDHNAIVREHIASHDGYEVKSQGDSFMVAFSSARRALLAAMAIQRSVSDYGSGRDLQLRIRIGLHTGEAIEERGDFFGRHIVMAARIASQARGGEILASSLVRALAESAGDVSFGPEREVELKGLSGQHRVSEVAWR